MKIRMAAVMMIALCVSVAFAERSEPAKVPPVTHQGIEYRAPHEKMGVVEAWSKATGKMLWEKKVYAINYDPNMEKDVQDIFITRLEIKDDRLIVTNESQARYSIDLKTQEVKKLDGPKNGKDK